MDEVSGLLKVTHITITHSTVMTPKTHSHTTPSSHHSTHNHIPRQQVHPHPPIINQAMPSQIILWLYNLTVTHCKDAQ